MKSLLLVVTLTLAACATPGGYWDHEHQDRALFDKDRAQCLYESAAATASAPATFSLSQNVAQDIATGTRRADLLVLCMNARGYRFVQQ